MPSSRYTCKLPLKCIKTHKCTSCQCIFRYPYDRVIVGTGGTKDAATKNAEEKLVVHLQSGVEQRPCPQCGRYQADMIGIGRTTTHKKVAFTILILMIVLLPIGAAHGLRQDSVAQIAIGLGIVGFLCHFRAAWKNPNGDLAKNQAIAAQFIQSGKLQQLQPGRGADDFDSIIESRLSVEQKIAFLLAVFGIFGALAPEAIRLSAGYPLNTDFYPPIVGPGDVATVYMLEKVKSVDGHWKGAGGAKITNASTLGIQSDFLSATSKSSYWHGSIKTKKK